MARTRDVNALRLRELFLGVLRLGGDEGAIEFNRRWWAWSDLRRIVEATDALCGSAGLKPGVRMAILLRNHPGHAAMYIDAVVSERCIVTLNPLLPDDRLGEEVVGLKAPVLVALASDWARKPFREAAHRIGCLGLVLDDDDGSVSLAPGLEVIRGNDLRYSAPAMLIEMLTSGTTGAPKRIPIRAEAIAEGIIQAGVFDGRAVDAAPTLRSGVQILSTPIGHIGGAFSFLNCIAGGRAACMLPRFTVESFADALRRHRPRVAGVTPSALRMILDAEVPKEDLESLVVLRSGTAPLDPDLADEFTARYGIPVLQNYGATEFSGGVAGWTLEDYRLYGRDKRGSVGRLNPGVEARIVDPESFETLPAGKDGLLELRAAQLDSGGAWMRTTDLAMLDQDDFLWIRGRADNAIIRGGFKIMPEDVLRALEAHPAIREAAVVGLEDPRLGAVPAAAYVLRRGAPAPTGDDLRAFLRDRLLPYQIPVVFRALAELPRTQSQKVSLPELKAELQRNPVDDAA